MIPFFKLRVPLKVDCWVKIPTSTSELNSTEWVSDFGVVCRFQVVVAPTTGFEGSYTASTCIVTSE